ncbi:MAG: hypothetical protein ABGX25_01820 [Nautiliaceae bacterium]
MRNKNYLQNLMKLYENTKNLLMELTKTLTSFYKSNNFKEKISLSVRIKKIESAIFYNMLSFESIVVAYKGDPNFDKKYVGKLVFILQEGIKKVTDYKKKVFSAKRKSKFLRKFKKNKVSDSNTTTTDTADNALALI